MTKYKSGIMPNTNTTYEQLSEYLADLYYTFNYLKLMHMPYPHMCGQIQSALTELAVACGVKVPESPFRSIDISNKRVSSIRWDVVQIYREFGVTATSYPDGYEAYLKLEDAVNRLFCEFGLLYKDQQGEYTYYEESSRENKYIDLLDIHKA